MNLEDFKSDLVTAMKAKDARRVDTIRLLISELKYAEIELKAQNKEMGEADIQKVLSREAKKRKESIEVFEKSGRQDLADPEKEELVIINEYLPKQMSMADVEEIVKQAVSEASDKNFGVVMKAAMEKLKGQADGKTVSELVRKHLS